MTIGDLLTKDGLSAKMKAEGFEFICNADDNPMTLVRMINGFREDYLTTRKAAAFDNKGNLIPNMVGIYGRSRFNKAVTKIINPMNKPKLNYYK